MFNCLLFNRLTVVDSRHLQGGTTKQSKVDAARLDCFVPRSDAKRVKKTTAGISHISCQSGKWQGFVSWGDKVTRKGLSLPFAEGIIRKPRKVAKVVITRNFVEIWTLLSVIIGTNRP